MPTFEQILMGFGAAFLFLILIAVIAVLVVWIKDSIYMYRDHKYGLCPLNKGNPCDAGGERIRGGSVMCCLYCPRFMEAVEAHEKYEEEKDESIQNDGDTPTKEG